MTTTIRILGALAMLFTFDVMADWKFCAKENGYCRFEGRRDVQYGAGSKWLTKTFTGGVKCDNNTFGDPLQGKEKSCRVSTNVKHDAAPLPEVTSAWVRCAGEGGMCKFNGTKRVAYGVDGKFRQRVITHGTKCINEVFGGDPVPGKPKACFVSP